MVVSSSPKSRAAVRGTAVRLSFSAAGKKREEFVVLPLQSGEKGFTPFSDSPYNGVA